MESFYSDKQRWTVADVAGLLITHSALTAVTLEEAKAFVRRMRAVRVKQGTVLFREGDVNPNLLAFILQGEALVETEASGRGTSMVIKVLSEGNVIGEMGVADKKSRSTRVTAATELSLAVMDKEAFDRMIKEAPALACSFLTTMLRSVGAQLRESNRNVHTLTQINRSLHEELDALRPLDDEDSVPRGPEADAPQSFTTRLRGVDRAAVFPSHHTTVDVRSERSHPLSDADDADDADNSVTQPMTRTARARFDHTFPLDSSPG